MKNRNKVSKELWISRANEEWGFYMQGISLDVTETAKRLENSGYIVKIVDPNDKSLDELRKKPKVSP